MQNKTTMLINKSGQTLGSVTHGERVRRPINENREINKKQTESKSKKNIELIEKQVDSSEQYRQA